jgi:octaprenyl-diphosphate synthase
MKDIAMSVKARKATAAEIARLIAYTKEQGGIEYAERKMLELRNDAASFIENEICNADMKKAFTAYLDYVIERRL